MAPRSVVARALWTAAPAPVLRVMLSAALSERLDAAARTRGITGAQLADLLLSTVFDDHLINAILDDGGDA